MHSSLGPARRNTRWPVTYWAPSTPDGFGNPSWATPVQLMGAWNDEQVMTRDAKGNEIKSMAIVYMASDVQPLGYLAEGIYTNVDDPTTLPGTAWEIKAFYRANDLRHSQLERRAIL